MAKNVIQELCDRLRVNKVNSKHEPVTRRVGLAFASPKSELKRNTDDGKLSLELYSILISVRYNGRIFDSLSTRLSSTHYAPIRRDHSYATIGVTTHGPRSGSDPAGFRKGPKLPRNSQRTIRLPSHFLKSEGAADADMVAGLVFGYAYFSARDFSSLYFATNPCHCNHRRTFIQVVLPP